MANLTLSVDDDLLKRARLRATEEGTCVDAVLRDHLEQHAGACGAQEQALRRLLEMSAASASRRGRRAWTRDELHER